MNCRRVGRSRLFNFATSVYQNAVVCLTPLFQTDLRQEYVTRYLALGYAVFDSTVKIRHRDCFPNGIVCRQGTIASKHNQEGPWIMRSSVARFGVLVLAVAILSTAEATAANIYWTLPAGQSGDWSVGSNWGGTVPSANDYAYIENGGTATISLPGENCNSLTVGGGIIDMAVGSISTVNESISSGTFIQSGGTNSVAGYLDLGSYALGTPTYNMSGGALFAGSLNLSYGDKASFNQSGGTVTVASAVYLSGTETYSLSGGGVLSAGNLDISSYHTGAFAQSGGVNTVSGSLNVSQGSYGLSGGSVFATNVTIGTQDESTGATLSQSGGEMTAAFVLIAPATIYSSNGNYVLRGGTLNVIDGLSLANGGTLNGAGGSASIVGGSSSIIDLSRGSLANVNSMSVNLGANSLILLPAGFDPYSSFHSFTSLGMIHDAGTPLILTAGQGFGGQGSISDPVVGEGTIAATPGGGINLNNGLFLSGNGSFALGAGNVTISDTASGMNGGLLQASSMYVSGTGVFTQSGGTNEILNSLQGSDYRLSGNALLLAENEDLGSTFQQTGGSNITNYLLMPANYLLSGGTLNIHGGLAGRCVLNGGGGSASVYAASSIIDLTGDTLLNTQSMSVNIDANSLLTVPAGFNPATGFGSFHCQGIVHTAGTPLMVPAGQGFVGQGTIKDPVTCQGSIVAWPSGSINLDNGLSLSAPGNINLGQGGLTVNDTASRMTGGSLLAAALVLGTTAAGNFTQSGGTSTVGNLDIGYFYPGSYSLAGSALLSSANLYVSYYYYGGPSTFVQSGGTNEVLGNLAIGWLSSGSYYLSGSGLLLTSNETLGSGYGVGSFIQSGGTNSVSGDLTVGCSYLGATYGVAGNSLLAASDMLLGSSGSGTLTQSGGTVAITNSFELGYSGNGTYNLDGGMLVISQLSPGSGNAASAAFNFNGGTLEASASFSTSAPLVLGTAGGNATIDPSGYTVTLSGSLTGPGNLIESGSGTLVLSGTNSYTGGTTDSAGEMVVTNSEGLADGSNLYVGNAFSAIPVPIIPADATSAGSPTSPVPESGTLALLACGAIGLLGARKAVHRANVAYSQNCFTLRGFFGKRR